MSGDGVKKFSIIIPVYNEEGNIHLLYNDIVKALALEHYYEIIFVDDGSTDATASEVMALTKANSLIRLIRHKKNKGQSVALVTGARAARYPLLVTLDGDGQNDPNDIPRLLAVYDHPKMVIVGNRKTRHDTWLKLLSSKIGNGIRRWWLEDECSDTGCSLKLFSKEGFLALPHFNHLHRFLPALFKRSGFKLVNIDVHHRARLHGKSKYGVMNRLFVSIYDLFGVRWLLKRPCLPEVYPHED